MIFLLEGVDQTGKSTLAAELSAAINEVASCQTIHSPRPSAEDTRDARSLMRFFFGLFDHHHFALQHLVLDRWWPSHVVYRPTFENELLLGREDLFLLEGFLLCQNLVYVHCRADADVLANRIAKDGEESEAWRKRQVDNVGRLCCLYDKFFDDRARAGCHVVLYDTTDDPDPKEIARLLVQRYVHEIPGNCENPYDETDGYLARELHRRRAVGWGGLRPEVLVLGDRESPAAWKGDDPHCLFQNDARLPFTSLDKAGCSNYLRRLLVLAGLDPNEVYVHNAWTLKDEELLLPQVVELLHPHLVVSVGNRAHDWLHRHSYLEVLHTANYLRLPHPQFMKRFMHSEIEHYAFELREATNCFRSSDDKDFLHGIYDEEKLRS